MNGSSHWFEGVSLSKDMEKTGGSRAREPIRVNVGDSSRSRIVVRANKVRVQLPAYRAGLLVSTDNGLGLWKHRLCDVLGNQEYALTKPSPLALVKVATDTKVEESVAWTRE